MTKTATLIKDKHNYKAMLGDLMLCQSGNPYRVVQQIRDQLCAKAVMHDVTEIDDSLLKGGEPVKASISVHSVPIDVPSLSKPYFSVQERFAILADMTDLVITRQAPSLLVTGDAKLGKSHSVEVRFKKAGLKEIEDQPDGTLSPHGDYYIMKGYTTSKALFRVLYDCRKRWVILDDIDKALNDNTAVSLLKAATDATSKRNVAWNSDPIGGSDLPKRFEFEGGVIAITNLPMNSIDETIRSRGNRVDLVMNTDEKLEHIRTVLPHMTDRIAHIPLKERLEVYEWLKENANLCKQLNFGTFISVCGHRHGYPDRWRRLAEYTVTA